MLVRVCLYTCVCGRVCVGVCMCVGACMVHVYHVYLCVCLHVYGSMCV